MASWTDGASAVGVLRSCMWDQTEWREGAKRRGAVICSSRRRSSTSRDLASRPIGREGSHERLVVGAALQLVVMEGDGVGPEITAATLEVLRAAERGYGLVAVVHAGRHRLCGAGGAGHHAARPRRWKPPRPPMAASSARCRTTTYPPLAQGGLNPSGELRRQLDLFANIRPARSRGGFPARCGSPVDLVIARENTEGFYADRSDVRRFRRVHADAGSGALGAQDQPRRLDPDRRGRLRAGG